jgi:hypothetical protein
VEDNVLRSFQKKPRFLHRPKQRKARIAITRFKRPGKRRPAETSLPLNVTCMSRKRCVAKLRFDAFKRARTKRRTIFCHRLPQAMYLFLDTYPIFTRFIRITKLHLIRVRKCLGMDWPTIAPTNELRLPAAGTIDPGGGLTK